MRARSAQETAISRSGETRHGVVLLMCAIMPIMAIVSLIPVLPMLLKEFASIPGSAFLVPVAITVPALCVALFSPLAGWLSDRIGRKGLLVATLAIYTICGILPWFIHDLYQIILARIGLGVAEAVIMTVATTLIGDYFQGERREKWLAAQVAVGSVAAIVLIAVGGAIAAILGSRGPFLLYLLALPICALAALILFEPEKSGSGEDVSIPFPFGHVVPLILVTFVVGLVFYTMNVQLGPVLEIAGPASPAVIGMVGAGANLGIAVGAMLFNAFKRHFGPKLLLVGFAFAGLGYAGAGLSSQFVSLALFAIVACIGGGMLLPNMLTWVMARLPDGVRGRGMGMTTGAFFLGQFAAPILATAAVSVTGELSKALVVYGVVCGLLALLALLQWRRQSPESLS